MIASITEHQGWERLCGPKSKLLDCCSIPVQRNPFTVLRLSVVSRLSEVTKPHVHADLGLEGWSGFESSRIAHHRDEPRPYKFVLSEERFEEASHSLEDDKAIPVPFLLNQLQQQMFLNAR